MNPDQAIILAAHANARINWDRRIVEVRDGSRVLGSTRWTFRETVAVVEARAWADAAARLAAGKAKA